MMFNQSNHSSHNTDYYNESGYDYYDYDEEFLNNFEICSYQKNQIIEHLVYSIVCILGFVGNSLVIATYAFYKRTKSMTDVYLLNVAIADLLFVLSLPLIVYNELYSWSMGPLACKLLRGSYSFNLYSGMLLLTCISVDRFITIVQARRSFRLCSLPYSHVICTIVWVCALLLSAPTFYFYNWYEPGISEESFYFDEEDMTPTLAPSSSHYVCEFMFLDNIMARRTKIAVPSTQLAVGFFLPMLIMVFCHAAVNITLLKARNLQRHKVVWVELAMVVVFIICHLPYNMTLLYDTATMFQLQTCKASIALYTAKRVTQIIAYLHCCLNPVLYAFFGPFRNRFRRIFQDLWCPRLFSRVPSEIHVSTRRSVDRSSESGSSFAMRERPLGSPVDLSGPATPGTEPEACQHLRSKPNPLL